MRGFYGQKENYTQGSDCRFGATTAAIGNVLNFLFK